VKELCGLNAFFDLHYHYHGKEACRPGHNWGPGIKDHYKFHFIHEGRGVYHFGGKSWDLVKGQGFLVYPESVSQYTADQEDPWIYSWCAFSGNCAELLLEEANLTRSFPIFTATEHSWFETFAAAFNANGTHECSLALARQSELYRFFKELNDLAARSGRARDGRAPSVKDQYVRKAIDYVHINYGRRIHVSDIADSVGIDRIYLARLFKESLSISPQAYLVQYRMEKASKLLLNPVLSISDAARSVGYEDPLLFSKMFKKVIGLSPRAYRQSAERG